MFKQLIFGSIYRRILGSFMAITALIAVVSLANFVQIGRVQETTSRVAPTTAMLPLIQEYTLVLSRLDAETERFLVIGGINIQDQILADLETLKELEIEINAIAPPELRAQTEELDNHILAVETTLEILFRDEAANAREYNQQVLDTFDAIEGTSLGLQNLLESITTQLQTTITSQQSILFSISSQQLILTVITIVGALIGSVILTRGIVHPITQIAETTSEIAKGNYSQRVNIQSTDEIGQLAHSFNDMAIQLEELIGGLELRVAERTRDLKVAADVSREVSRVLNMKQLLPYLVNLTHSGFELAHVNIYLYESENDTLHLAAGSGDVGQKMLSAGKKFHRNDKGLVPLTARTFEPQIINDVQASEDHVVNPLLPNTRSETTLPMHVGTRLIGVLDLQSNEVNHFKEEQLAVLTSLAGQIAVAVRNAELFSEAQEARTSAERADQVKSAFLASMSHELRTPLNSIINFTKFVVRGVMGPVTERQVETLNKVVNSGHHLLSLINDVLDMSKIESGSLNLFIEDDLNLNTILETVLSNSESLLNEKSVKFEQDIQSDMPIIRGDRKRITQILLNIVSNACKFTEEGFIKVKAHIEQDNFIVSVQDTGPGIAEEDKESVFLSFKQTHTGLRQGEGTGLGMPISKSLAEAHGGKLWFESTVGKGTTFYVKIPIQFDDLKISA